MATVMDPAMDLEANAGRGINRGGSSAAPMDDGAVVCLTGTTGRLRSRAAASPADGPFTYPCLFAALLPLPRILVARPSRAE